MIDDIVFVLSDGFLLEQGAGASGQIAAYSMDGTGFDIGPTGAAVTWGST